MSFLRHRKSIVRWSREGKVTRSPCPRSHRLDEFPPGYSSASCTPALLASASPGEVIIGYYRQLRYHFSANGIVSPNLVSHLRGSLQNIRDGAFKLQSRCELSGDLSIPTASTIFFSHLHTDLRAPQHATQNSAPLRFR